MLRKRLLGARLAVLLAVLSLLPACEDRYDDDGGSSSRRECEAQCAQLIARGYTCICTLGSIPADGITDSQIEWKPQVSRSHG